MMRTGIVRSECWKNENENVIVRLIWPKTDMLKSLHIAQLLTLTPKYPAKRRAPIMMSREPIKKRTVAKAMALYGTFGGLFLNCRGETRWNYERNTHLLTIRDDSDIHTCTTKNWINWIVFNTEKGSLKQYRGRTWCIDQLSRFLPVNRCIRHHLLLT